MHASTPPCRFSNRGYDVGIAGAAAQIAAHTLADFDLGEICNTEFFRHVACRRAWPSGPRLFDHRDARHDLSRRAESALESVVFNECRLNRVELPVSFEPFNGGDPFAVLHGSEGHTGQYTAVFDMNRAGSALAPIASLLCAGQSHAVA